MSTSPAELGTRAHALRLPSGVSAWLGVGFVFLVTLAFRGDYPWLVDYPRDWVVPVADWVNAFMTWFIEVFRWLFRGVSWLISWPMDAISTARQVWAAIPMKSPRQTDSGTDMTTSDKVATLSGQ